MKSVTLWGKEQGFLKTGDFKNLCHAPKCHASHFGLFSMLESCYAELSIKKSFAFSRLSNVLIQTEELVTHNDDAHMNNPRAHPLSKGPPTYQRAHPLSKGPPTIKGSLSVLHTVSTPPLPVQFYLWVERKALNVMGGKTRLALAEIRCRLGRWDGAL